MKYLSNFLFFPFYAGGVLNMTVERIFYTIFKSIGGLILETLQFSYSMFINITVLVHRIKSFLDILINVRSVDNFRYMTEEIKLFKKIPQHVVIIIGGEEPSYQDFVKIITWCVATGISNISFYDHHNGIDSHILFEYFCQKNKHFIPAIKWGKSFTEEIKKESKLHINGYKWTPLVTVNIYRAEDGPSAVLSTLLHHVRNSSSLHQCDTNNKREAYSSVEQTVYSRSSRTLPVMLRRLLPVPDPELAIVTGPALCMYGFPPWQLRLTEFLNIPTHHGITASVFLHLLRQFSDCEQRFGN